MLISDRSADVAIIGAGPAGTTTAILLKLYRPSARIVLIERERFPRHRVGESTLPDANPVLAKLGVLDAIERCGFVRKGGITYKWRNDQPMFSEEFAKGVMREGVPDHAWQVDRARYDAILLHRAIDVGVEVWQPASVVDVIGDRTRVEGVIVAHEGGRRDTLQTRFVVDCSGQLRLLGRLLRLDAREHALGDLAIYRYYAEAAWLDGLVGTRELSKIFFAATPTGWIWYIPLADDLTSVGLVTRAEFVRGRDLDTVFDAELAHVDEMATALRHATRAPAPGSDDPPRTLTTRNWSFAHADVAGDGWYLAGDAAAFVDPILSSGLLLAHRAGLSVANAIRTEWDHSEVSAVALRAAYSDFHADLCSGFVTMAEWWYHQRDAGIEDWWKRAAELSRARRAGRELDDLKAFMDFAAGYLTDFRFTHIGPAFGAEGLGVAVVGLSGVHDAGDALRGRIADRTRCLHTCYDRAEQLTYWTTYVETDRWWDLPAVRFVSQSASRVYRPPVQCDADGTPRVADTLRTLQALLASCDGLHGYDDVVTHTALRIGGASNRRIRAAIVALLADLIALGVIFVSESRSRIGACARRDVPRSAVVSRAFDRFSTTHEDAPRLVSAEDVQRRCMFAFETGEGVIRYVAPIAQRDDLRVPLEQAEAIVHAVVSAVDGTRVVEHVVRRVVASCAANTEAMRRDLANVVVADLVSVGVLRVSK